MRRREYFLKIKDCFSHLVEKMGLTLTLLALKFEISGLVVGLAYGPNGNYRVHIGPYMSSDRTYGVGT